MHNAQNSLNDTAWEQLFSKYDILDRIADEGRFCISAAKIKEFREPRLMAKFDHAINLPEIFKKNQLAILPITRGKYIISHFEVYHKFENNTVPVKKLILPEYLQSLDSSSIPNEAIALNYAVAAGIVGDFLQDEYLVSTVSGRMSSGIFDFNIYNKKNNSHDEISVDNSQIEIDAAYEGVCGLALFEAKCHLSDDFLIRQLYYPYRLWKDRVLKPVRSVFLIYSNSIYRLYEYAFQDMKNYNSLILKSQKNYSVEDTGITISDIEAVLQPPRIVAEPKTPFPQADCFERVINICELLSKQELSRDDITERYAFDVRQTTYYTDAARYLGLLERQKVEKTINYKLCKRGECIFRQNYKERQLALCDLILSHKAFGDTLREYFKRGSMPSTAEIIRIMRQSNLYHINSDSTFERRASTIKSWLNWIISLINE